MFEIETLAEADLNGIGKAKVFRLQNRELGENLLLRDKASRQSRAVGPPLREAGRAWRWAF